MRLIYHQGDLAKLQGRCVATIGAFDGLHLAHQKIIKKIIASAQKFKLPSVVVLFEPQPKEFFAKDKTQPRLSRLRDKFCILEQMGVDVVICLRFNAKLVAMSSEQFVVDFLVAQLHVKHLIVGDDFGFGKNRAGGFSLLEKLGSKYNFTIEHVPEVYIDSKRVSSTRVREAIKSADFSTAKKLLNRDYAIFGRVVHGDKRGRVLGFPTMNINLSHKMMAHGVYVVQVLGLGDKMLNGIANIGVRPTFDHPLRQLLEVHVLDFDANCYGKIIQVRFLHKIRDEKKFNSMLEIKQQIREDVRLAREYLCYKIKGTTC